MALQGAEVASDLERHAAVSCSLRPICLRPGARRELRDPKELSPASWPYHGPSRSSWPELATATQQEVIECSFRIFLPIFKPLLPPITF